MRMRWMATGLVVMLMVVVAACGDDDDASGGGGGDVSSIEAVAREFEFDPDSWTVPAGEEFTIDFSNAGALEHEWAVIALGGDLESEDEFSEDKVLLEVEAIPGGESTEQSFTIEEAGTYQVICAIPTHFDAGMEGSLTVE